MDIDIQDIKHKLNISPNLSAKVQIFFGCLVYFRARSANHMQQVPMAPFSVVKKARCIRRKIWTSDSQQTVKEDIFKKINTWKERARDSSDDIILLAFFILWFCAGIKIGFGWMAWGTNGVMSKSFIATLILAGLLLVAAFNSSLNDGDFAFFIFILGILVTGILSAFLLMKIRKVSSLFCSLCVIWKTNIGMPSIHAHFALHL